MPYRHVVTSEWKRGFRFDDYSIGLPREFLPEPDLVASDEIFRSVPVAPLRQCKRRAKTGMGNP